MDLTQLKYFLTIAKYQNITQASNELNIAQPALSMSLGRLEEMLGVKLFERRKRKLYINEYGRILQNYGLQMEELYEKALEEIDAQKNISEKTLFVGISDWGFPRNILSDFVEEHPEINLNVNLMYLSNSGRDVNPLAERGCDILITPLPVNYEDVSTKEYYRERLYIAVPRHHRLYDCGEVDLCQLTGEHIYLNGYYSHFGWFIRRLLQEHNVRPGKLDACTAEGLPKLVTVQNALAFMVKGMNPYMESSEEIRFLPITPATYRSVGLASSSLRSPTKAMQAFEKFMEGRFERGTE